MTTETAAKRAVRSVEESKTDFNERRPECQRSFSGWEA
jgi:hypothetical protein